MKNNSYEDVKEEFPEKPIKLEEVLSTKLHPTTETAKVGIDKKKQLFVRFPRGISDALNLEEGHYVEFTVLTPIPKLKDDNDIQLECKILRGKSNEA